METYERTIERIKQLPKIHSEVMLEFVKYKEDNYSSQRNIQNETKKRKSNYKVETIIPVLLIQ